MTTKLDGLLRRTLVIGRDSYTLTLSPEGLTLALKGRRKGLDLRWTELVSGEAALATALNASLTANIQPLKKTVLQAKAVLPTRARKGASRRM